MILIFQTQEHGKSWPSLISPQITNAGESVEKREPSYTVGGNVSWSNQTPHSKRVWRFLKKLNIELPYDLAIPPLGIYLEKTIIQKDTCAPIVHHNIIYNSQDTETTQMSIDR